MQGGSCSSDAALAGLCPTNSGSEIIIDGSRETPRTPGTSPIIDGEWTPNPTPVPPAKKFNFAECLDDWDSYIHCFRGAEEPEAKEDDPEEVAEIPAITISDIARFAPDGSALTGEPDNVGVAGLPTNFVATATAHTVDAELFGFPLSVRFTPAGYDFDFGDGKSTTTNTGGSSWTALGQAQFTPTATSHTYAERGTYSANVDVRYTAEVDFGVGWFPIAGEITAAGPAQEIRIFEAHTALVAHTCAQSPRSPGC